MSDHLIKYPIFKNDTIKDHISYDFQKVSYITNIIKPYNIIVM